ncbi:ChaN family lipoprotein [Tepidicella baoligensis]|uniref:ChaN family lipoprotein n=1 Tax=Tepidicella baoligensis TaxID=2707016 RepID=UPI0015DB9A4D|nr:ChaN family lipoprotein [Tepidicella baoligensis]
MTTPYPSAFSWSWLAASWRLLGLVVVLTATFGLTPVRAAQGMTPEVRPSEVAQRVDALLPAQVLIIGEQHDADAHQALQAEVVHHLASRELLHALVLEMAPRGHSTTGLPTDSAPERVQQALAWPDADWPWERYGPVVMVAVRSGVPVHGGNLPRWAMRSAMTDTTLDRTLPPDGWQALQALIHTAHCELLPASQWPGMARIQIARDQAMAHTVRSLLQPDRVVLLLTGRQHARKDIGVPWQLAQIDPALPTAQVRVIDLRTAGAEPLAPEGTPLSPDAVWPTPAAPPQDHCAALRQRFQRPAGGPSGTTTP